MASMHINVLAGKSEANAALATEDVVVNNAGDITKGRDAFVNVIAATQQGHGAFPVKQIHDDYIIADGRLGLIEYVWEGKQQQMYGGRAADNKTVRVRGMLWFEFNSEGLVEKVTSVYDESAIGRQLESSDPYYLYP